MSNINNPSSSKQIFMSWTFPEEEEKERSLNWYIWSGVIGAGFLGFAIWDRNFLFAVIILMVGFIYFYSSYETPLVVEFQITDEGVTIGKRDYKYAEINTFWFVYEPSENIKVLYLEFKRSLKPSLEIPLKEENPLEVRKVLSQYLDEDYSRQEETLSDTLSRVLKL